MRFNGSLSVVRGPLRSSSTRDQQRTTDHGQRTTDKLSESRLLRSFDLDRESVLNGDRDLAELHSGQSLSNLLKHPLQVLFSASTARRVRSIGCRSVAIRRVRYRVVRFAHGLVASEDVVRGRRCRATQGSRSGRSFRPVSPSCLVAPGHRTDLAIMFSNIINMLIRRSSYLCELRANFRNRRFRVLFGELLAMITNIL